SAEDGSLLISVESIVGSEYPSVVASVAASVPIADSLSEAIAEDSASLKLVLVGDALAPPVADDVALEFREEIRADGSESCCCIATIWLMRLSTAEILIVLWDRRFGEQLEPAGAAAPSLRAHAWVMTAHSAPAPR
ncbi:MAG TPA: hypothetical protein VME22_13180, partial [Solirubrobacteraceae bacterium]|nr:hypothetical protein [Solirubrobacteraceae bacterium]